MLQIVLKVNVSAIVCNTTQMLIDCTVTLMF